ncbi:MAG: NADPH-dependent oxidoreductase [Proteobacteria bacterium]|nr:NADPH-dependent oxidoreductase [Pseudomonadota bacterium]MCL2307403.1 NADPH-dependent oxidoreductase [Pseudomonadota bacterium]
MSHHSTPAPASLLEARYGKQPPLNVALNATFPAFNPTLETLLSHRSVRAFLETPLPPETLEWLIAAAQSAPSSCNLQMWSVVAVENRERKARLADLAGKQRHIKQAPLLLVFLADMAMLHETAAAQKTPVDGMDYLDTFLMAAIDATLAAQNVATAAESLGFGTVYAGALRNQPEEVIRELNLPPHVFPVFGLCIGYPDPERPAQIKPRLPQRAVLHREQYSNSDTQQAIADYDATMAAFYSSYRDADATWSKQSLARLREAESLAGRDRLREAILKQGILLR